VFGLKAGAAFGLAVASVLCAPPPLAAQGTPSEPKAAAAIEALKEQLIAKARAAQEQEDVVAGLERQIVAYRIEAAAREAEIADRRDLVGTSLGALQRFARRPPEALLVSKLSPGDALRSSFIAAALVPELESEVRRLNVQLTALRRLETEIKAEAERLGAEHRRLDDERRALDQLLERKLKATGLSNEASRRKVRDLAKVADEAKDVPALIAGIARVEPEPERTRPGAAEASPAGTLGPLALATPRPFAAARGTMVVPARGRIVAYFGQTNEQGIKERGLSIETLPAARVVAPHEGQVVFAGPFRTYGQLLILAHGAGYHTLIAGLARIDSAVGQNVSAGEPLGRMADGGSERPVMYLEMRHDGAPVDPLQWLAALERKVKG
jgi:septal ring factor EnvC (AmiA/AmiB activator)